MSLDVYIKFKKRRKENYFLTHPYSYDHLSKADEENYTDEEEWWTNITHNIMLCPMSSEKSLRRQLNAQSQELTKN